MKDAKEQRRHTLTVVAIVVGGGGILFVLANAAKARAPSVPARASSSQGGTTQRAPSTHSLNFAPNPAAPALDASIMQARAAALATYDQSAVAERAIGSQTTLGLNQDRTAQAIAFNQTAAQVKETGLTTAAQQAIAQEEAQAQLQGIQAQTSAAQSIASGQQSTSLWQSIIGGIGSFLPFLGFNVQGPTGYGTGYVNAAEYANPFAVQDPMSALGAYIPPVDYSQGIPWPSTIGGG